MYCALVLTEESHGKLVAMFSDVMKNYDEIIAHHMTIHMGPATKEEELLVGKFYSLVVFSFARNEKVMAVGVSKDSIDDEVLVNVKNSIPHITMAVNRSAGGKPVMSNQLTSWSKLDSPVLIRCRYEEVK
jgi:hypothetical protein